MLMNFGRKNTIPIFVKKIEPIDLTIYLRSGPIILFYVVAYQTGSHNGPPMKKSPIIGTRLLNGLFGTIGHTVLTARTLE